MRRMAELTIPHYHNDSGVPLIEIGAREFMCIGARPPFDHPHVFIDLGDDDTGICPYCATVFRYRADLAADETSPPGHLLVEDGVA
jgi:uncharacterized Zn-finger protein